MSDLTPTQQALLGLNMGLGAYDWSETRKGSATPGWTERNPVLGSKPSPDKINEYFGALGALGIAGVNQLPDHWKTPALIAGALVQGANLQGKVWGNPSMLKPRDKNSVPLAAMTGALGALGSGAFGKNWNVALSGTSKQPEIKLAFKKDF